MPPRAAAWLLARLLPTRSAHALIGDLDELYREDILPARGKWRAALWYWAEAFAAVRRINTAEAVAVVPPFGAPHRRGLGLDFVADLRHGVRQMRRAPAFTVTCIALLGIGIGTTATLVLQLDTMVTHPVPGVTPRPTVVRLDFERHLRGNRPEEPRRSFLRASEFSLIASRLTTLSRVAASVSATFKLTVNGTTSYTHGAFITEEFFPLFGNPVARGHAPSPAAEDGVQVVISHALWLSSFGGDSSIVGRAVSLDGISATISGVAVPRFTAPTRDGRLVGDSPAQVWVSLSGAPALFAASLAEYSVVPRLYDVYGELAPGATKTQADVELGVLAQAVNQTTAPPNPILHAGISPLGGTLAELTMRLPKMFWSLPLIVLLVACTNVSILLLGRGLARQGEIAVRLALGASRRRVVALLLTHSLLLGVLGGFAALAFAWSATRALGVWFPDSSGVETALGWRTVLVSFTLALATAVLFGTFPALYASDTGRRSVLGSASTWHGHHSSGWQHLFVVVQMATSMALVCTTGLVIQKLYAVFLASPGFEISPRTLAANIGLDPAMHSPGEVDAYVASVRTLLLSYPEVEAVSLVDGLPLDSPGEQVSLLLAPSAPSQFTAARFLIDPEYFRILRIPLLDGHDFTGTEPADHPVALVTRATAEALWPGTSPIGKTLWIRDSVAGEPVEAKVIGVVAPVSSRFLRSEGGGGGVTGTVFLSRRQQHALVEAPGFSFTLLVRLRSPSPSLGFRLREAIRPLNPKVEISGFESLTARHARFSDRYRMVCVVGMLAGLLTLLMACSGVYAVTAFSIGARQHEIGVRVALGARSGQVIALFFRESFALAFTGFAMGVPLSVGGVLLLVSDRGDNARLGLIPTLGIPLGLFLVVMLASWLPARRALRVDPMRALQSD